MIAGSSVAYAALPVMRHAAGVLTIEGPVHQVPVAAVTPTQVDLAPIFEVAPFGKPNRPNIAPAAAQSTLPAFVLRGVFLSTSGASSALLDVDGTTGVFRQTETVAANLALRDVAVDFVTLSGPGQTITLRFDDEPPEITTDDAPKDFPDASPQDLIARLGGGVVVPARYQKPKPPETTSEYIDYWRKRIQKNPKAVLDEIGLTPSDQGYVIANRHDPGVRLAGLKAGDLVRSVNGQTVGDPDDDRRFFDRIAASGHARLEVERNGRVLTFSFPLR